MKSIKTLSALAAIAALAGTTAFAAAGPGQSGEACWLQAETGRNMMAISAWTAPGVTGEWTLSLSGGTAYESEQSGYVEPGRSANRPLTRLVVAQGAVRPPLTDFRAGARVPVSPGTTVIASNYSPAASGALPLQAELRVYDGRGELLCETREVWHRAGR